MSSVHNASSNAYSAHHNDNEEISLLDSSPTHTLDQDSTRVVLVKQKYVYSSITLADVFQKVAFTTVLLSFLVFGSSYLGYKHVHLMQAYFVFTSVLWLTTAFVNLFVEYCMSRRHAILVGFACYFIGVAVLTGLSKHFRDMKLFRYIAFIPLYFVCLGEGFCKSFIGEFGHYQFEDARLSDKLKGYTHVLYWVGNTCAVLLILALLGICETGSYVLGMGLCCVCISFGGLSFIIGWKHFRKQQGNSDNSFKLLYDIISNAKSVRNIAISSGATSSYQNIHHWLDYGKLEHGGNHSPNEVEEAKSFFKVTCIFFSLIPYWVCNTQGYSTFIFQGFHLNLNVGSAIVPVSWTALCNIASVLIFLKVSEKYIYPALRRNGYSFPASWRVITGMFLMLLSMFAAAIVQLYAYYAAVNNGTKFHKIGKVNVTYVSEVHILWTTPQYIFLGVSEVLVGVTTLTLACKLCPKVFRRLVTSVYYLVVATGHIISLIVLSLGWFPSNRFLDGYEMVIYFSSLAALCIFGMFFYLNAISQRASGYTVINS